MTAATFPACSSRRWRWPTTTASSKRKRESKKRGLLRGIGIGCYLEVTAGGGKELGAIHFDADGTVTIITGTMDFGMGHATTYAQMLSDMLGVPFDRIRTVEGDSDRMASAAAAAARAR